MTAARTAKRTTKVSVSDRAPPQHLIVGIGASAGGLEAFTQLLHHLPTDTGMAFVLVQHLDPVRESALTELLSRATSLSVREVTNDLRVEPNHIYIIPPNTSLTIANAVLKLQPRRLTAGVHRSIDFFFESLAQDQRERAIGVILSGTATDGTLGLEAIKAEGGITFAQDDSARYDSMPRSAIAAGCVDFVCNPEDIAKELGHIAKHPLVAGQPAGHLASPEDDRAYATAHEDDHTPLPSGGHGTPRSGAKKARAEGEAAGGKPGDDGFKKILLLLRSHCGVDFSLYKSATIQRRISRRMVLSRKDTLEDYAGFLRGNTKELDALYSDVLISVTSFFRNPDAFDVLQRKVFPKLLQQRGGEPLRVWVLGCSTGQEAYSIAMAATEIAAKAPRARKLQIFATDLHEALLQKARQGLYAKSLAQDVSPERLRQFFVEEDGGYRISKALRDMVVFARQNLISDPPFSRMDLVSCRNLLIYLEPSLQKKALPTFHYALKPEGFLFLGASESITGFTDLFEPVDRKQKIFSRKAAPTPAYHLPTKTERGERGSPARPRYAGPALPMARGREEPEGFRAELNSQREADRVMVNKYAPPGVLVNAELQIIQFRGSTSAYLEPPTGKASFDVLKMAREGLMLPLRAAINKAKKENKTARRENVRVKQNGETLAVNVEVIPLKNLRERCFLILFVDVKKAGRTVPNTPESEQPGGAGRTERRAGKQEESRRVAGVERELFETRDYLQSIQEQYESANEELQASNEEVQSANEELQSTNEELETSKEELESTNEELNTVNEEMANRNTELNRLNSDLINLQASTPFAIVLLGRDLTIRRFNPQAEKQFNLLATDAGRPIGNVRHNLDLTDLETFVGEVIVSLREKEREVRDKEGRWYSLRVRPYLTLDNKVDGAVLALVDIDTLKRSERDIEAARDYAEAIIRTARDPLIVLSADLRVHTANEAFCETFKITPDQTHGCSIFDLSGGAWRIPQLRMLLEDILPRNSFFNDFEVTHDFPHIGRRTLLLNARRLDLKHSPQLVLLAIEDVTERQRADAAAVSLAAIVNSSDDAIIGKDLNGVITSWNKSAERLFGYTAQEAIGQPITMLIPPDRLHEEPEILARLKRGERVDHFETIRTHKNRSPLEISLTVSPMKDATGQVIGASKIARNITERKAADVLINSQRQALQLLAEGAPLDDVLGFLIGVVESRSAEGMLAAITLLNEAGTHFQRGIGASLPDAFNAAVEGVPVSSPTGLCAQAVTQHEAVAVRDFNEDPWQPFGKFVAPYGLRSGWSVPIISSSGQMLGTFANYYRHAGDPTPQNRELVDVVVRTAAIAIERKRAEETTQEALTRFQVLADNMPTLCWTANADGSIFWYNHRWYEYTGTTPQSQEGWGWQSVHDPETLPAVMERWKASIAAGQPFEMVFPLKGADGVFRPFLTRIVPLRDEEGRIVQWFGTNTDITSQRKAEERLQFLMNELAHRGQNQLAVIQSIASRSLTGTRPLAEARDVLMQRLHALARSQSALVTGGFAGASLAEIIRLEFEAFSERVNAVGPDVTFNPKAAQTFTLVMHELATNASKYGALSQAGGQVDIHWSIEGAGAEARFKFQWQERNGPPVIAPTRQGFGRIVLEKAATQDFGAPPKFTFAPEGLIYEIDAPLSVMVADSVGGGNLIIPEPHRNGRK